MKSEQLQRRFLSDMAAKRLKKTFINDDEILIVDGFFGIVLAKNECYLNYELMENFDAAFIMDGLKKARPLKLTNHAMIDNRGQGICRRLDGEDGEKIYVKSKYLKRFDALSSFAGTTKTNPIFVYELGKLVGVICPVRITEDE